MRLRDRKIVVTGGGSGFGAAMCRRFAREGARVLVADVRGDAAEEVAGGIGDSALAFTVDVSDGRQVAAMVDRAVSEFGDLDVVVNNAGIVHRNGPLLGVDERTFDRLFAVNVKSIYWAVQAAVPVFRRRGGGTFLNTASTGAIRPRPGLTWYNATKGAVMTLTRSLAAELAPDRIRVNAILPVLAATGMLEDAMGLPDTPDSRARFIPSVPLGRLAEPEDVANAAVYLVSEREASFITGVCLPVDGGRTI